MSDTMAIRMLTRPVHTLPEVVNAALHVGGHLDDAGPWPAEPFARPLLGSVDPHLGTVIRKAAGVIERIDRAHYHLDISLRVDVVERFPGDLAIILHVNRFIHHDDHL